MKRPGMQQLPLSIHVDDQDRVELFCDATNDCAGRWLMFSESPAENGVSFSNAVEHVMDRHPGVFVSP